MKAVWKIIKESRKWVEIEEILGDDLFNLLINNIENSQICAKNLGVWT